jgi:hypothetical protein
MVILVVTNSFASYRYPRYNFRKTFTTPSVKIAGRTIALALALGLSISVFSPRQPKARPKYNPAKRRRL